MTLQDEVFAIGGESDAFRYAADGMFIDDSKRPSAAREEDPTAVSAVVRIRGPEVRAVHHDCGESSAVGTDLNGFGRRSDRNVINRAHRFGLEINHGDGIAIHSVSVALAGGQRKLAVGSDDDAIRLAVSGQFPASGGDLLSLDLQHREVTALLRAGERELPVRADRHLRAAP